MSSLNSQISKRAHKARGRTLKSQITEIDNAFGWVSKTHLESVKKSETIGEPACGENITPRSKRELAGCAPVGVRLL